ncbi:signal transduction histidine kinase [Salirhabdus euzebyi]|uniref:Signal transduction histidine kinase n=1 Tax=Salirhabdus euzebyi TaxID=394506 RepID=A0A841PSL0_9BACI|nr:DUF5668 domain-containing protein [Salirhabdus euzebyi]MBB6451937.1 signal transduction histidine kinase [Salirhabdus euzebyi]
MKKQYLFTSSFMIGVGLYFFITQYNITFLHSYQTWPTLLIIIGVAFLIQGFFGKVHESLFPGIIILGFGIHFHGLLHYSFWIDHWGVYLLVISIAFFIQYQKTKNGLIIGVILLVISLFAILSSKKPGWLETLHLIPSNSDGSFLPFILVGVGIYLIVTKR